MPTDPALLPVPHRLRGALFTVAFSVMLGFTLWTLGGRAGPPPMSEGTLLMAALHRIMAGIADVVTTGRGAGLPARLTVFALSVLLFVSARAWRRACLAAGPGPVAVMEFEDGGDGTAPRVKLRSLLRKQLSETRLYPPATGGVRASPTEFLDVVTVQQAAPANWLSALLTGVGWASRWWPQVAYQVDVTLLRREQRPDFGMTVTVTSRTQGDRSAMTTLWGRSWEDVTCHAGYWVMAVILPVTKQVRIPPWRLWRGRTLPVGLFQAYTEGQRHHDRREFDLALWQYGEALRDDPFNIEVRLLVADVLEQLGLYLEALDIYSGALSCVAEEHGACTTSLTWRQGRLSLALSRRAQRIWCRLDHRPDLRLRYRYANALATTERTVHEWFVNDAHGERATVREQAQERLRASLTRQFATLARDSTGEPLEWAFSRVLDGQNPNDTPLVELLFRLAARHEISRLCADLPFWLSVRRLGRSRGAELTGRSLHILRDVWATLRVARLVQHEMIDPDRTVPVGMSVSPEVSRRLVASLLDSGTKQDNPPWWPHVSDGQPRRGKPPTVEEIAAAIEKAAGPWPWRILWPMSYADHYNAACAYSIALDGEPIDAAELASNAVGHLRAAMASVETGVAARVQDWVLADDLDLAGLRCHREFRHFQRDLYPHPGPLPEPTKVATFDICSRAYARQLILDAADLLEGQWHDNAGRGRDIHHLVEWLHRDTELWKALHRIVDDGAWYWRDRALFIRLVQETVDPAAVASAGFPPSYPRYEEVRLGSDETASEVGRNRMSVGASMVDLNNGNVDATAGNTVDDINRRFKNLRTTLAQGADMGNALAETAEGVDRVGGVPGLREFRDICTARAARWQALSKHLQAFPIDIDRRPRPEDPLRP